MGRPRTSNAHLPPKVYQDKSSKMFYFVDVDNKYHQLGRELSLAMTNYYKLMPEQKRMMTLADLIDRYMIEESPKKAPTTHDDELKSARQLRHRLGHLYATEVTSVDVAEYYTMRYAEATVRVNREMSLLSVIFKQAPFWGVPIVNPIASIRRKSELPAKAAKKYERYITDEQVKIFKLYAKEWMSLYIELKLILALRQSAMLRLKRSMIRDDGFFVKDISKNGGGLTFTWTKDLKSILDKICQLSNPESEYLFVSETGQPHNASSFKSAWQRAMKKATDNELEKPFAERYLRNKAVTDAHDLETASKTVGHTNPLVTKLHYCMLADRVNPFGSKA